MHSSIRILVILLLIAGLRAPSRVASADEGGDGKQAVPTPTTPPATVPPTEEPAAQPGSGEGATAGAASGTEEGGAEGATVPAPEKDWLAKVPPADPTRARLIETQIAIAGDAKLPIDKREEAVRKLLELNDPSVLPYLFPLLSAGGSEEADQLRMAVMMGVIQRFTDQVFPALEQLIERGDTMQRQAAAHGMGRLFHPRQPDVLIPLLGEPDEALRRAAVMSLLGPVGLMHNGFLNHALIKAVEREEPLDEIPPDLIAKVDTMVDKVLAEVLKHGLDFPEEVFYLLRKAGDRDAAQALVEHFAKQLPPDQKEVGELIRRLFDANRAWLGQTTPMRAAAIEYRLDATNFIADKTKPIPLIFTSEAGRRLRGREVHWDRAVVLELPLEALVMFPQACKPSIQKKDAKRVVLEYRVPVRMELQGGMGSVNVFFWSGRTAGASKATVEVDVERWVPLVESIFDAEGEEIGRVTYGDYQELEPGVLVPMQIQTDILKSVSGKTTRHMQYEYGFQLVEGNWLLKEGTANEVVSTNEVSPKANAELFDITITSR